MPPIKVYKLDGNENFKDNPKENQTPYLQGWTVRPTKFNFKEKWWKTWDTIERYPMMWVSFATKKITRKGQLSYKQCKIELGWKEDHPKDCFKKCQ
jgi:hypothetical protein